MRTLLLASFLVVLCISGNAQPGTLDVSFGNGGKVLTNIDQTRNVANSVLVQPDGKIVVIGFCTPVDYTGYFALARYNSDGTLDDDFGVHGVVTTVVNGNEDIAFSGVLQSDGKIIAAGYTWTGSDYDFAMVRYNADGTRDLTFGTSGIVQTDFYGNHDSSNQILLQPDGKIVLLGYTGDESYLDIDMAFARYHSNGSSDNTFGNGGLTIVPVTDFEAWDVARAGVLQVDGKVVIAGFAEILDPIATAVYKQILVLRLNSNGLIDQTFGDGGMTRVGIGEHAIATSVVINNNSEIIVLAETKEHKYNGTTDFALLRFSEAGILDPNFGTNGMTIMAFDNSDDTGQALLLQSDQKILAGGYTAVNNGTTVDFALARFNANGTLDETFATNGKVTIDFAGGLDFGGGIALQNNGKILMVGSARAGSDYDFGIVRLENDASLPVTIISFKAEPRENDVFLEWRTSHESNSDYFEIQRSGDGVHWRDVHRVSSSHFSYSQAVYSFSDPQPMSGKSYYRLKMIDFDGSYAFSSIAGVSFNTLIFSAYPNPTSARIKLCLPATTKTGNIRIFDRRGNDVSEKVVIQGTDLDLSGLPDATYSIIVTDNLGNLEYCTIMLAR